MDIEAVDEFFILSTYARNYTNFVYGDNARVYDDKGNYYIDFMSGIGVASIGHGNKLLSKALCEQAQKIIHISNLFVIEPQAALARKIVKLSGYDMACFFANSGAEANEGAIKIARKYGEEAFESKRYRVITLEHSFHGRTITTVKATGQENMHTPHFSPYPDGFCYVPSIDDVYRAIDDETVGVLIELVQGEGGVEPLEKEKVQKLAVTLKEEGLLLIVDEVQTGVYRTGEFLASNFYEIEPDIITLAKGLGGGVPIGVVMTTMKEIFKPGEHGSTFGGNYLSTTAGNVIIDHLLEEYQSGRLYDRALYFEAKLEQIYNRNLVLFDDVVGIGLMRGLRCKSAAVQERIVKKAFDHGLLVLKAGRNTVRFLPPLTITTEEIDEGFVRFEKALMAI